MKDQTNNFVQFYFSILIKEKENPQVQKDTKEIRDEKQLFLNETPKLIEDGGITYAQNYSHISQELLKNPQQESSTSEDMKTDVKSKSNSRNSNNSNHKTQKSFICAFEGCDKKFDYKWILDRHINSHFCFKLHKCDYAGCEKAYKSRENLNLHIRNKHLGEKPYQCRYCISRFSHRNGINCLIILLLILIRENVS
jgi:uncharacterized Zn-finger protein